MDRKEFAIFAMALKTYFPRENLLPTEEAMELWFQELKDIPAEVATAILRKWVDTQKWPPTIAEIRTMCSEIVQGQLPDWGEAWREVEKAIGRYGYTAPEKALASLSPVARKAAERIGWLGICMSENTDIIRAQFRQVYEICSKREVEDRQLPTALKETIQQISGAVNAPMLEERN